MMKKRRKQISVRLPASALAQLDWLREHAELPRSEAISIAIDRLWNSYQKGRPRKLTPFEYLDWLHQLRNKRGEVAITQREAAERLGVSLRLIADIEAQLTQAGLIRRVADRQRRQFYVILFDSETETTQEADND